MGERRKKQQSLLHNNAHDALASPLGDEKEERGAMRDDNGSAAAEESGQVERQAGVKP